MIECFERYGDRMDWAMIILNPFEPWPGQHVLGCGGEERRRYSWPAWSITAVCSTTT
jgi:hypothetical protein